MVDDFNNMSPEEALKAQKQNCIFCKITSGEIPSKKVYEDANFVGILDINPAAKGHVLIIPKEHYQIMPQIPPDIVGLLGVATKNVSSMILKAGGVEGTTIFIGNGFVAGQKAPHFIVHVIPRKTGDGINLNPKIVDIDESEYAKFLDKIRMGLGLKNKEPEKKFEKETKTEQTNKENNEEKILEDEDEEIIDEKSDDEDVRSDDENNSDTSDLDLVTKMFTKL